MAEIYADREAKKNQSLQSYILKTVKCSFILKSRGVLIPRKKTSNVTLRC